jgi:hypothetical protein
MNRDCRKPVNESRLRNKSYAMRKFILVVLISCPFLINAQQADIALLSDFIDSEDSTGLSSIRNLGKMPGRIFREVG